MRTVIIEDEDLSYAALLDEVTTICPELNVIGRAKSVSAAVKLIESEKPELVMMDINLTDGTGFEILKQLDVITFKLIFTTAYRDYAIEAVKCSALDYLLKPIDGEELRYAVDRALKNSKNGDSKKIETYIYNHSSELKSKKIALQSSGGVDIFEIKTILHCKSEGNYTKFFFSHRRPLLIAKTLKEFERILEPYNFIRPHASHVINLDHLVRYVNQDGGYILLSDDTSIPVSKRKKNDLLEILMHWKG